MNNEQRKHISTTLRLVGVGVLVTVFSKALIGSIELDLTNTQLYGLTFIAVLLEIQAVVILGGIADE